MAEDRPRKCGGTTLSSGLAVVLNGGDDRRDQEGSCRRVSYCDDFGEQSVESTLEHIFDLPNKTINLLTCPVDTQLVGSILKNQFNKYHVNVDLNKDGASTIDDGSGTLTVSIEESSICGDIRITKHPLVLEGHSMFSSVRSDACVWKGKWMYEVTLETSGIQQIGWATLSCPFTDQTGVGDADDSYAYDGKRVCKWNKEDGQYGQPWVVGDVIGCCIDLDHDEISFYRNGVALGVAFRAIRKMVPGLGYYPAISLSQGERCELNFGAYPFRYPVETFLSIQSPPLVSTLASKLLSCFSRLLEMQQGKRVGLGSVDKLRRLKRFASVKELYQPVSRGICEELFSILSAQNCAAAYISRGPLLSFILEVFKVQRPHDYRNLDIVLDCFLDIQESRLLFDHLISSLAYACKTAPWILSEFPYSGPYIYLSLACHILQREELMILWWSSPDFEYVFEGLLSWRSPNKHDLETLMPSVWWPGSSEDISSETSMLLTTSALSEAINMVEEKHRELCCLVMKFIPPSGPPQRPGSVFKMFIQNLLLRNRGADRNLPPLGVSSNSVLVSLYTVILHLLSERSTLRSICGWMNICSTDSEPDTGFLHRGGEQSFPVGLFLKNDPLRIDFARLGGSYSHLVNSHATNHEQEEEVIRWEEGCVDDEETRATHFGQKLPCCCYCDDSDFAKISKHPIRYKDKGARSHCSSIPERSAHVTVECTADNLNDEIEDKPGTSDQSETQFDFRPWQQMRIVHSKNYVSSATLKEEELLDAMILLYYLGVAPNFKQASSYNSRQSYWTSLLEETDKQIREKAQCEGGKRLKDKRRHYREEMMNCVRQCAWYRISLFSRWKQKGMYAACMWIVQLLLILSKFDSIFIYVPEYYLETLVDSFHVLRKSDPPFVPPAIFIKQGLASFVTFVVTHFNDPRISSAELKDLLLQSISVLVQYREFVAVFEHNEAATQIMPKALLSAFDNRSWVPVTNILVRLCKSYGFGSSKQGEPSSLVFPKLLRDACVRNEELFLAFLNRLFNTLSWSVTEFSVSVREMHELYQHSFEVVDYQQKKCSIIFDLLCNLARVVEFCTHEIPQAFLRGADTNLRRLAELIVFIISQLTSAAEPELLDMFIRRPGQCPERVNKGMILAPLAGIILNLLDATGAADPGDCNDIVSTFASMGCSKIVRCGFDLLGDNWACFVKGVDEIRRLGQLKNISSLLIHQVETKGIEQMANCLETDHEENICCICYGFEADTEFLPCSHVSCHGCITRHLLNCQRCFFCNAIVIEVVRKEAKPT